MTWEAWISFAIIAGAAIVTPGPGNLNTLWRAVELGYRSAFFSLLGNVFGLAILGVATGLGLLTVLMASPVLWVAFQWIAVSVLVFLALQMIATPANTQPELVPAPKGSHLQLFFEAIGVSALNPKAAMFFVAVFPLYTDPVQPIMPQVALIVVTCLVISAVSHGFYISLASLTRQHLRAPNRYRIFRVVSGLILLGLAALLFARTVMR